RLERDERPSRRDADELSAHRGWIRRARDSLTRRARRLSLLLHAAARHGVLPRLWRRGERPPGCNATVRLPADTSGVGLLLLEVFVLVPDVAAGFLRASKTQLLTAETQRAQSGWRGNGARPSGFYRYEPGIRDRRSESHDWLCGPKQPHRSVPSASNKKIRLVAQQRQACGRPLRRSATSAVSSLFFPRNERVSANQAERGPSFHRDICRTSRVASRDSRRGAAVRRCG